MMRTQMSDRSMCFLIIASSYLLFRFLFSSNSFFVSRQLYMDSVFVQSSADLYLNLLLEVIVLHS